MKTVQCTRTVDKQKLNESLERKFPSEINPFGSPGAAKAAQEINIKVAMERR